MVLLRSYAHCTSVTKSLVSGNAGIGFTMSMFLGNLDLVYHAQISAVKFAVLGGSLVSALAGILVLRFAVRRADGTVTI